MYFGVVLALAGLCLCDPAFADQNARQATTQAVDLLSISEQTPDAPGQRLERTHLEDDGSRIDEVRYGGETRSVTVQPKARVPAYEMRPSNGARQSYTVDTTASPRVWNLLNF